MKHMLGLLVALMSPVPKTCALTVTPTCSLSTSPKYVGIGRRKREGRGKEGGVGKRERKNEERAREIVRVRETHRDVRMYCNYGYLMCLDPLYPLHVL